MANPDRLASIAGIPVTWLPGPLTAQGGAGRNGPTLIVLHDIEGSAQAGIDTLAAPGAGGSIHFIADPQNDRYVQMVGINTVAWGCGNWFHNQRAIQLEIPGKAGTIYDTKAIQFAGMWAGEMSRLFGIPLVKLSRADLVANPDASGICGHEDVPDPDNPNLGGGSEHHGDPGSTFPWQTVLSIAAAGGTLPPSVFPTGYAIAPRFAAAFAQLGGVPRLGYPISRDFVENGLLVQYCERARLEWNPHAGGGGLVAGVTLGLVGAELVTAAHKAVANPAAFTPIRKAV